MIRGNKVSVLDMDYYIGYTYHISYIGYTYICAQVTCAIRGLCA